MQRRSFKHAFIGLMVGVVMGILAYFLVIGVTWLYTLIN